MEAIGGEKGVDRRTGYRPSERLQWKRLVGRKGWIEGRGTGEVEGSNGSDWWGERGGQKDGVQAK